MPANDCRRAQNRRKNFPCSNYLVHPKRSILLSCNFVQKSCKSCRISADRGRGGGAEEGASRRAGRSLGGRRFGFEWRGGGKAQRHGGLRIYIIIWKGRFFAHRRSPRRRDTRLLTFSAQGDLHCVPLSSGVRPTQNAVEAQKEAPRVFSEHTGCCFLPRGRRLKDLTRRPGQTVPRGGRWRGFCAAACERAFFPRGGPRKTCPHTDQQSRRRRI